MTDHTDVLLPASRIPARAGHSSQNAVCVKPCGCRKPMSPERMRRGGRRVSGRAAVGGAFARGLPCDAFRLAGLKLIFLVTRAVSVLGLSRREAWWKDAEILMLRHQLAVALRERPGVHSRLTGRTGRGWPCLPGRCQLHAGVQCGVPGGRDPGHPLRRSGTANEFDHGAVDWQLLA